MEHFLTTLCDIPLGSSCEIDNVDNTLSIKHRLHELGFLKGAIVDKLQVGAYGSPIAFRVCGAIIAIRSEDANRIIVKV